MNIARKIDSLCSPLINYPKISYPDQISATFQKILQGNHRVSHTILLFKIFSLLCLTYLLMPVAYLLWKCGFRFMSVDLTQIGGIRSVDAIIKYDILHFKTKRNKMFLARSKYTDAAPYMFDLYERYFVSIYNPLAKLLLAPFFMNTRFNYNILPYDTPLDHRSERRKIKLYHAVSNEYNSRYGVPLLSMPADDAAKARYTLSTLLPPNRPFVLVHARDSGFYQDFTHTSRNSNIFNHQKAFQYLIEKGYAIVRMGGSSATPIDSMQEACGPNLIDYARSGLSCNFLDLYLFQECSFFIGGTSGPLEVAMVLNKPSCLVNFYSAGTCLCNNSNSISTFKKLKFKEDNSLVPLSTYLKYPLTENPQPKLLEKLGYSLEENSEEEIYLTVKEFLEDSPERPTDLQQKGKEMLGKDNFSVDAAGHFSNTILNVYKNNL